MEDWLQQINALHVIKPIQEINEIDLGYSQPCFKLTANNQHFFAKYIAERGELAETELNSAITAMQAGLAPKIIHADKQWLITEFIEGHNLANSHFNLQQKSLCALNLMAKFHQLEANVETLNIEKVIHEILSHSAFPLDKKAEIYLVAASINAAIKVSPDVLCHGDFNFSNILFDQQAWLVDYECSCIANAEFDLAMYVAINNLLPSQIPFFCQLYQSKCKLNIELNQSKLTKYLSFCYLINGLWFLCTSIAKNSAKLRQLAAAQLKHFDDFNLTTFQTLSLLR
jgi:thiamine kinase-like enzyme